MSDDESDVDFIAGLESELANDKKTVTPLKIGAAPSSGKGKAAEAKTSRAKDDSQDSFFASQSQDDDDDDDDDDVEVDHEPEPDGKGSKLSATPPGVTQPRGLEDSAANKRGAAPGTKGGLEDSAANKQGSAAGTAPGSKTTDSAPGTAPDTKTTDTAPGTKTRGLEDSAANNKHIVAFGSVRQRYISDDADEDDGPERSPFSTRSTTPDLSSDLPRDGPSIALVAEASLHPLGQELKLEESPAGVAEKDFILTPTHTKAKAKRPPPLQTSVSRDSRSGVLETSNESDATAASTGGAGERVGRVDTGDVQSMTAAQAQVLKRMEAQSQARLHKQLTGKAITDADFAGQDALNAIANTDKRTGLSLPSVLELFQTYDQDRTGAIHINEFKDMLTDLDGLKPAAKLSKAKQPVKGARPGDVEEAPEDRYVRREFERADLNGDELVSIDEFYIYFYSTLCFKFPMLRTGVNPGADLLNIYMKYCSFGKGSRSEQMDCSQFAKLCSDAKLLNGKTVTKASCDIVWFRARAELENLESFKKKQDEYITSKMLYPQFLFALLYIAEKRRSGLQEVITRILKEISPLPMPSCADYLVLKNDGSPEQLEEYLQRPRGLPKAPENSMQIEMRQRMEKEAVLAKSLRKGTFLKAPLKPDEPAPSDGEGGGDGDDDYDAENSGRMAVKPACTKSPLAEGKNVVGADRRSQWGLEPKKLDLPELIGIRALTDAECMLKVRALKPDELIMACRDVFHVFNRWQGGTSKSNMDKIRFVKLIRDCQYITETPGGLTQNLLDGYYAKVLPPAQNTINFMRFMDALRMVATKLRISLNAAIERIVLLREPLTEG